MSLDLGQVAHTVTKALDYVGVDDKSHGRRVGLMCHRVAHILGWNRELRHFMLIAGMLHDCGVSSTTSHQKLVDELEWFGADGHCVRGADFLQGFAPFAQYAQTCRHHHTRWQSLPDSMAPLERQFTNLVFLMDRFDVVLAVYGTSHQPHDVFRARDELVETLRPHSGTLFSPALFEAMREAIRKDSFFIELEEEFLDQAIFETLSFWDHSTILAFDDIMALGEMISQIVDAKSHFTHYHSLRVADLVYALGGLLGLDPDRRLALRLTGLLHDIGKLRTPDEILEKPGALLPKERDLMLRHPLDSKLVLASLFPGTPIAKWASQHHEKLNGSGYPFGWTAERIDTETRILTMCDIFQALCQIRPYRGRLPVDDVVAIMQTMVTAGELDPSIFRVIVANRHELYKIAIREGMMAA
ncbi:HD-GYP domain-containing protein [Magnetospirillum sp. LM-5]|uniref:HD-GYP domain-containing protein n=1 Tax=Magnetospirillum sp. LM-5 TaxID=2681466 RepID=UPI0015710A47|nr:HD domain-containing phosphohydrolase [Magnetospirillum sp. LM-5]